MLDLGSLGLRRAGLVRPRRAADAGQNEISAAEARRARTPRAGQNEFRQPRRGGHGLLGPSRPTRSGGAEGWQTSWVGLLTLGALVPRMGEGWLGRVVDQPPNLRET